MDQLDVNLSDLRVALVELPQARSTDLKPSAPLVDGVGKDDVSIRYEALTEQSASARLEAEPARSWFQRLFGV